jgi:hypothetical protein
MPNTTDLDLTTDDIAAVASLDDLADFIGRFGYDTAARTELSAEAVGYNDSDGDIRQIELGARDELDPLRVVVVQLRSITAKVRNGLVRPPGQTGRGLPAGPRFRLRADRVRPGRQT